ncbi:unnamed protein product [Spirodela intermedia]|uniref:Uncharacterized protein n=1 Tax=Spirodela intermedia TaxID=51605 RepID=A0ABN7ECQ3_SPIIN|nr:unnamed protein product [Spirodela intermedia]
MESWGIGVLILFLCFALWLSSGLPAIPILNSLMLLNVSKANFQSILWDLWFKYGSVMMIHCGSHQFVIVDDQDLIHEMLVQHGALLTSNQCIINIAHYSPLWWLLQRLATEILNPSHIAVGTCHLFSSTFLLDKLCLAATAKDGSVVVKETFRYAMFSLLVLLCFWEKLEEAAVTEIEAV